MTHDRKKLTIGLILIGVQLSWAMPFRQAGQGQVAPPQGAQNAGARQTPPRGRSITLGDLTASR